MDLPALTRASFRYWTEWPHEDACGTNHNDEIRRISTKEYYTRSRPCQPLRTRGTRRGQPQSPGRYCDNSEGETRQAAPLLEGRQQSGRQSLSASASSRSLNSHEGACSLTSLLPRQPKKAAADAWCSADRLSRCLTAPPPQGGPCGKQRSRPTRKRTQHGGERRTVGPSR